MSLSTTETARVLYRNLNALTYILSVPQHSATTESERKMALHTMLVTAEAGYKLAETAYVDALTHNHTSGGPAAGVRPPAARGGGGRSGEGGAKEAVGRNSP